LIPEGGERNKSNWQCRRVQYQCPPVREKRIINSLTTFRSETGDDAEKPCWWPVTPVR
jgi:hypothetical protein